MKKYWRVPGGEVVTSTGSEGTALPERLRGKFLSIDPLHHYVVAVMIESVDGRPHPAQAKIVIAAKKPLGV